MLEKSTIPRAAEKENGIADPPAMPYLTDCYCAPLTSGAFLSWPGRLYPRYG